MDGLLKTYIEKVDRDQSSLQNNTRESERRTEKRISQIEDRMDARLEKIEKMIESQSKNMSLTKDSMDDKMSSIKDSVNNKMDENKRFMCGIVITIMLSIVASISVVVATYFSTIALLQDMVAK